MKRILLLLLIAISTSSLVFATETTDFTRFYDMNDASTQITDTGSAGVNWSGGGNAGYGATGKINDAVTIAQSSGISDGFSGTGFGVSRTSGKWNTMGWFKQAGSGASTYLQTDKNAAGGDFSCFVETTAGGALTFYCGTYGVGGLRCDGNTTGLRDGNWKWFTAQYDGSGATDADKMKLWASPDTQETCTFSGSFPGSGSSSGTGGIQNGGGTAGTLTIDAWAITIGSLSTSQNRTDHYNNGDGTEYVSGNFLVTLTNSFNSSSINTFNATVNGSFFSTTNGTIHTNITENTGTVNVTVEAESYQSRSYIDHDTVSNLAATATQSVLTLSSTEINTNNSITSFTIEHPYGTETTTNGTLVFETNKETHTWNWTSPNM